MISNQCQVFLLIWLHVCVHVCVCVFPCLSRVLYLLVFAQVKGCQCKLAASWRVTVTDVLQQVLSRAGLCNLYLTLVRIIIWHLFVQF